MSHISADKDYVPMDIDFHDLITDQVIIESLKANLIINNIKEPIFDYYKYLKMTKSENEILNDVSENNKSASKSETISEIDKKEQIDEIKVNLFFILFNGCDYNDEYKEIIIDRYIKAKRLIIQNYSIIDDEIKLEKKQYRYMKIFNQKDNITFNDGSDKIVVDKKDKKNIKMILNEKELLDESDFIKNNTNVKNITNDIKLLENKTNNKSRSAKSVKNVKSVNMKMDDNSSKESINNMDNNTISMDNHNSLSFGSVSNELEDSEKEIKGLRFYSENKRYIFLDLYSKEIDGVFTIHNKINLIEGRKDLMTGLDELLSNDNKYDINNDIKSHIIYKNFDDSCISEDRHFIIEVKKSMDTLPDLLNQIKDISKVVGNLGDDKLPKLIIGIICRYSVNQIKRQKFLLELKKENETFLQHTTNIINKNNVHVIIGAIKDEQILNYPLGVPDFDIKKANLKTRIDIYYMNNLFKKLNANKMKYIYDKYSKKYESINYLPFTIENYDNLLKINKKLKETHHQIKLQLTKMEKKKNEIQKKYENERNEIQQMYEKEKKEKDSEIENLRQKVLYYKSLYLNNLIKKDKGMDKKKDDDPNSKKDN